jgi:hypothetical protein
MALERVKPAQQKRKTTKNGMRHGNLPHRPSSQIRMVSEPETERRIFMCHSWDVPVSIFMARMGRAREIKPPAAEARSGRPSPLRPS